MGACSLLGFDLGACLIGLLFWWVPLVPLWAWVLVGLALIGVVWKLGGWPALVALAAGAGVLFGRFSRKDEPDPLGRDLGPDGEVSPPRPRRQKRAPPSPPREPTWFDRVTGKAPPDSSRD